MAYITDAAREYLKQHAKDDSNETNLKNYIRKNFHWTLISPSTDILVEFKNNYAYITMNDEYDDKFIFTLKIDKDTQFKNWQAINLIIKDSNNKLLLDKKFSNNATLNDIEDAIIDTLDMSYEVNGTRHKAARNETTEDTTKDAKKLAKDDEDGLSYEQMIDRLQNAFDELFEFLHKNYDTVYDGALVNDISHGFGSHGDITFMKNNMHNTYFVDPDNED